MIICGECGNKVTSGSKFCQKCGTIVENNLLVGTKYKVIFDKIKVFIPLRTDSLPKFIVSLVSFGIINFATLSILGILWFFAAWGSWDDGFFIATGLLAGIITSAILYPIIKKITIIVLQMAFWGGSLFFSL